jgi:hypothetical protein
MKGKDKGWGKDSGTTCRIEWIGKGRIRSRVKAKGQMYVR